MHMKATFGLAVRHYTDSKEGVHSDELLCVSFEGLRAPLRHITTYNPSVAQSLKHKIPFIICNF
jgi:hypothetical protein